VRDRRLADDHLAALERGGNVVGEAAVQARHDGKMARDPRRVQHKLDGGLERPEVQARAREKQVADAGPAEVERQR